MTTNIEWTRGDDGAAGMTWNPLVGCSKISTGCKNCYAETMAKRLRAMALADIAAGRDPGKKRHYIDAVDDKGRWTGKLIPVPEALDEPLRWKKPRRVFVNSMSDLFHKNVPHEFIDQVFAVMALAPQHTFQILTKRAERISDYCGHRNATDGIEAACCSLLNRGLGVEPKPKLWPLPNVWLGVSAEDQQRADERIPFLIDTPAAIRFLSCEPLLNHIDLSRWLATGKINWVIIGGESGPGARPCDLDWIESIIRQCRAAEVPVFVKQLGARPTSLGGDLDPPLKDRKGGDTSEWPWPAIREFPRVAAMNSRS